MVRGIDVALHFQTERGYPVERAVFGRGLFVEHPRCVQLHRRIIAAHIQPDTAPAGDHRCRGADGAVARRGDDEIVVKSGIPFRKDIPEIAALPEIVKRSIDRPEFPGRDQVGTLIMTPL